MTIENEDFLDDYVSSAPLEGNAYAIDTVQVHTFLLNFVTGNNTAEAKIQGLSLPNDGREAFKRLVEHYTGVGIHAINIREADEVLKTLFYGGEKPPYMWWSEFEKRLTRAFNAYVKREGRIVHSDSMKIRMLVDKIKADFLTPTKAQLEIELSRVPMTITYEQSLSLFRNMVNQKHPPKWEQFRTVLDDKSTRFLLADATPGDELVLGVEARGDDMEDAADVADG